MTLLTIVTHIGCSVAGAIVGAFVERARRNRQELSDIREMIQDGSIEEKLTWEPVSNRRWPR